MKKLLSFCALLATGVSAYAQVVTNWQNGLYRYHSSTVKWGGPLNENTTIDLGNTYFFNVASSGNDYFRILSNQISALATAVRPPA